MRSAFLLPALAAFAWAPLNCLAQVNGHAQVTGFVGTTLNVTGANETYDTFEDGEQVIVMQMQSDVAGSNLSNNASFGDIFNMSNAGKWEIKTIVSHTESLGLPVTITVSGAFVNSYSICSRCAVQVITYPTFGAPNWATTAPIPAVPWNGAIGGVIAFRVPGTLTVGHDINASSLGFRGGAASANFTGTCSSTTYTTTSTNYGGKGEGVQRMDVPGVRYGRGKLINGAGGGSTKNAGGGGGGHVTQGGAGGGGYNCTPAASGLGGLIIYPWINYDRFFMGGGGGGGQADNGTGGAGGNGGGIIIIQATTLQTLPGAPCPLGIARIIANGQNGFSSSSLTPDGAGGGGAGGTVYLDVTLLDVDPGCPLICAANGGNGGSVVNLNPSPGNWVDTGGGGGGGGQGFVACGATVAAGGNATTSTQSGVGGVHNPGGGRAQTGLGAPNSGVQGFGGAITLPVELLYFTAKPEDTHVRIEWATLSEQDNRLFRVQRSADLESWTTVAERLGAGWSSSQHTYDALDLFPLMGTSYYRLEQEDQDGERRHSGIATVDFSVWEQPRAYPVPADRQVTLLGVEPEGVVFTVIDLSGRVMQAPYTKQDDRAVLSTELLSTGTYLVQWTTPSGEQRTLPIVVAH
jgi:hypothetical protein